MTKEYNTRTASLKATIADIRNLDAKQIKLNDKNILDYIKESEFNSYDTRDPQLKNDELDIWNAEISLSDDGHIEVKPHVHGITFDFENEEATLEATLEGITESQLTTLRTALKVIDNEVLGENDEHVMYWQTNGLANGLLMFFDCDTLATFTSDLSSLTNGGAMFNNCSNLTTFSSDLSSLTDGGSMFQGCKNLTSFTSDLSSLKNSEYMFEGCENLTTFSYDLPSLKNGERMFSNCDNIASFTSDLSSLTNGKEMFCLCDNLTSFSSDLSSLTNGGIMFQGCKNLTSFTSNLHSLTNGYFMFYDCQNLTTFSSDSSGSPVNLSSLTSGEHMFRYCYKLTTFSSDLPSLTNGEYMFNNCENLTTFSSDLSSLTNGDSMFNWCSKLTTFSSDLSSLTNGEYMFSQCENLTTFSSDLSSLTNGYRMFRICKLDAPSVANIIHFIPQRDAKPTSTSDSGNILIGVGIANTDAAKQAFAEECYCNDWDELNQEFDDKNWAVEWQFNGEATTFDLRSPRPSTAVYAKLEEVFMPTEEEIAAAKAKREHIETPYYDYTSQDGSKFYNIHWYHDSNTNNEGFDYFESLEEAALHFDVIEK